MKVKGSPRREAENYRSAQTPMRDQKRARLHPISDRYKAIGDVHLGVQYSVICLLYLREGGVFLGCRGDRQRGSHVGEADLHHPITERHLVKTSEEKQSKRKKQKKQNNFLIND